MKKRIKIFLAVFAAVSVIAGAESVFGASNNLVPISSSANPLEIGQFKEFLVWLYRFALSSAAILAIIMIIMGGIEYIISGGSSSKRESARKKIEQALLGLLLAVGAYLILYTINKDLVEKSFKIPEVTIPK